mgnify:CR=1 FL=1
MLQNYNFILKYHAPQDKISMNFAFFQQLRL